MHRLLSAYNIIYFENIIIIIIEKRLFKYFIHKHKKNTPLLCDLCKKIKNYENICINTQNIKFYSFSIYNLLIIAYIYVRGAPVYRIKFLKYNIQIINYIFLTSNKLIYKILEYIYKKKIIKKVQG